MNEQDERHLTRMQDRLSMYARGELSLATLIGDLEALMAALTVASSSWRRSFHEHWGTLEQVYAVTADRGEMKLDKDNAALVDQTVKDLSVLVEDARSGRAND